MILRLILSIILINISQLLCGMDYGMRFKAHDFPIGERSSLILGGDAYDFDDEMTLAFELGFYKDISFGQILTAYGNDGTSVSLVSSDGDEGFHPSLIINEEMHGMAIPFDATENRPVGIAITFNRKTNEILFKCGRNRFSFPYDLSAMKNVRFVFGKTKEQTSIAPFDIKDINLYADGTHTHRWELRNHTDSITADCISDVVAVAENPYWLHDDHIFWKNIYTTNSSQQLQTAFDPNKDIFYIVGSSKIVKFFADSGKSTTIPVSHDGRMMRHSNYLTFDPTGDRLISYNLDKCVSSFFDFADSKWSTAESCEDEPAHANHGFAVAGRYAYAFGGYGFYKYSNDFFRIDLTTGDVEKMALSPMPDSRKAPALCVVGEKLYLFGGLGNQFGKQEMPLKRYYDLWEYDLKSMKGHCLWRLDSVACDYTPSLSMYYVPSDSCFYAATTLDGCAMVRIKRNTPSVEVVSEPIGDSMEEYRDCMFNLYKSDISPTYYLVIDRIYHDLTHDYAIYSLSYPFGDVLEAGVPAEKEAASAKHSWLLVLAVIIVLLALVAVVARVSFKHRSVSVTHPAPVMDKPAAGPRELPERKLDLRLDNEEPKTAYFDRSKASISLLGQFEVRDASGADITPKFSMRIKDILIMLVLFTEKYEKGLNYKTLDENIWPEKDEKSAKNNRNVYMRKLRLLLEEVGDISISCVKGYYRIEGNGIRIDYLELKRRLAMLPESVAHDSEEFDKTLELLLQGPLLINVKDEWLDPFKADFTDSSLRILNRVLQQVYDAKDYGLAYRIADIISLHDPLSEEALAVKCRILYARKMTGPAKNLYDAFCKEYAAGFGEEFNTSFSKIIGKE